VSVAVKSLTHPWIVNPDVDRPLVGIHVS
jgi:hypothetical protein